MMVSEAWPARVAALGYAARGWAVFPAMIDADGAKKSYKSAEYSGGRRWGATTDPYEIGRDFARWPDALVGSSLARSPVCSSSRPIPTRGMALMA